MLFEDMPLISYDNEKPGWHHVYNGILSPFANKFKVYIKSELKSRALKQDSTKELFSLTSTPSLLTKMVTLTR